MIRTAEDLQAYFERGFPGMSAIMRAENVEDGVVDLRLFASPMMMRPGGTISGPSMMLLADSGIYAACLVALGADADAYTANLTINFLRVAGSGDLIARSRLLRAGKTLLTGETVIRNAEAHPEGDPVAQATASFVRVEKAQA